MLPQTRTVVKRLSKIRAAATDEQVAEGIAWYPQSCDMIRNLRDQAADTTGKYAPDTLAVGIFAAFSQNATWKANKTLALRYLMGEGRGLSQVLAECARLEGGSDPTSYDVLGLKRADFCANLLGDMSRVTCDRWHLRAAFRTPKPPKLTPSVHSLVTSATLRVAADFNEDPATSQAIIWCALRGTGK